MVSYYDNKGDRVHSAWDQGQVLLLTSLPSLLLLVQLKQFQCDTTFLICTLHTLDQHPLIRSFSCLPNQQKLIQPLQNSYKYEFVKKTIEFFMLYIWYGFCFLKQKQSCSRVKILIPKRPEAVFIAFCLILLSCKSTFNTTFCHRTNQRDVKNQKLLLPVKYK